jgi:transcriptional regulator with XRE-family HTH domain
MNMKKLRKRSGKTVQAIAAELGVSVWAVRSWDQRATSPHLTPQGVSRLMQVYGCTLEELVAAEEEQKRSTDKHRKTPIAPQTAIGVCLVQLIIWRFIE